MDLYRLVEPILTANPSLPADLADQLARHADELAAHHEQRTEVLATACGLPGYAPTAAG